MNQSEPSRPVPTPSAAAEGFCLAICHDLRSPLATAAAAVHELARALDTPSRSGTDRYLEIARQSLSKADELLGALPDLLARESVPLRTVELAKVVSAVRDDVQLELDLCSGSLRAPGPLPDVLADSARLRIALRNLVHNAIRHRRSDIPPEILLRAWPRGDLCTLTISDNGKGIRSRANSRSTGLGIGLAIARQSIEASGGTLSLCARAGNGTIAAVTLPMARGGHDRAAASENEAPVRPETAS